LVDSSGQQIWSVIPGISYSDDCHSFVQVINANSGQSFYFRYPLEAFQYSRTSLMVRVGSSIFKQEGVTLDLENRDLTIKGALQFEGTHPFPVTLASPGIMGWYGYVPFMECYHGVVSMQHGISGTLDINGTAYPFNGGKGYIEKDWGASMPSDWIWIQSNHFKGDPGASFMISLARIPWLKGYFPGFLGFLLTGGKLYRFATYNRSVVERLAVNGKEVLVTLRNRKLKLVLRAFLKEGVVLKAPRHGVMERDIRESMVSRIQIDLYHRDGELIFSDSADYAGVEIVGQVEQYFNNND
jgi:tocopherol cyclase